MEYNKLVRNKIPEILEKDGKKCTYRILTDDNEYKKQLENKLCEEILEYLNDPSIEELMDIKQVLTHLEEVWGIKDCATVLRKNRYEYGNFSERIYLEKVED